MQTLKKFDFKERGQGSEYDWDKMLDGKIYSLKEGEDYKCKTQTFNTMIRKQAQKRGVAVKVSKQEDGVVIQAGPPGSAPERKPRTKSEDAGGEDGSGGEE